MRVFPPIPGYAPHCPKTVLQSRVPRHGSMGVVKGERRRRDSFATQLWQPLGRGDSGRFSSAEQAKSPCRSGMPAGCVPPDLRHWLRSAVPDGIKTTGVRFGKTSSRAMLISPAI